MMSRLTKCWAFVAAYSLFAGFCVGLSLCGNGLPIPSSVLLAMGAFVFAATLRRWERDHPIVVSDAEIEDGREAAR